MKMTVLGKDTEGVTQTSLSNLKKLHEKGHKLVRVILYGGDDFHSEFHFEDGVYIASGFSWGYPGTGPHGLHMAILMFEPEGLDKDFYKTLIGGLDQEKSWIVIPGVGITELDDSVEAVR
jgi:hypothetical protein